MRILFNALQAANRSGTGRYATELLSAIAPIAEGAGLELSMVWPRSQAMPQELASLGHVGCAASGIRRLVAEHVEIPRLAKAQGADLVHYPANFGPARSWRPVVVTVHDLSFMRHPEWFRWSRAAYYRAAIRHTVRNAAHLIADSESTRRDLIEILGLNPSMIDVVPLGVSPVFQPVDSEAKAAIQRKYTLPEHFFLYVGTLEPRKNLPRLIKAWSSIAGSVEEDLVLAGRPGWKTKAIEEAIASCPDRKRIHQIGHIPEADLAPLIGAARAFLWPSLFEGFGLPPLEAMACGTPVIASNSSSMPEALGDAALLVDPLDTEALADAMKRLATGAALQAALRQKGLCQAKPFTWRRSAEMTIEVYNRLLRGAGGR